ncbi:MAG: hypothetical protein M3430_20660 [Acidobacteriota bacterium]|nr:hypothetical protein [Acidobacteriota bacterium]
MIDAFLFEWLVSSHVIDPKDKEWGSKLSANIKSDAVGVDDERSLSRYCFRHSLQEEK